MTLVQQGTQGMVLSTLLVILSVFSVSGDLFSATEQQLWNNQTCPCPSVQEISGIIDEDMKQFFGQFDIDAGTEYRLVVQGSPVNVHLSSSHHQPTYDQTDVETFFQPTVVHVKRPSPKKRLRNLTEQEAKYEMRTWTHASDSTDSLASWVDHSTTYNKENRQKMRTLEDTPPTGKVRVYVGVSHAHPHWTAGASEFKVKLVPLADPTYTTPSPRNRGFSGAPVWEVGHRGDDGEDPTMNSVTGDIRIEFIMAFAFASALFAIQDGARSQHRKETSKVEETQKSSSIVVSSSSKDDEEQKTNEVTVTKVAREEKSKSGVRTLEETTTTTTTVVKRKNSKGSSVSSDTKNPLAKPSASRDPDKTIEYTAAATDVAATPIVQDVEYVESSPTHQEREVVTQSHVTATETTNTSHLLTQRRGSALWGRNVHGRIWYEYYQGSWDTIPDHNTLEPVKVGYVNDFTHIPPADHSDHNQFFYRYRCKMYIRQHGQYQFWTNSGDGSIVKVDGIQVVNNDGLHEPVEKRSTFYELAGGWHDLEVRYIHNHPEENNTPLLEVGYKGPDAPDGIIIPDTILTPGKGKLLYSYYQGDYSRVPDFKDGELKRSGSAGDFITSQPAAFSDNDNFAYKFVAKVQVLTTGDYIWKLRAACGAKLLLDGDTVVNCEGSQTEVNTKQVNSQCARGWHDLEVRYYYKKQEGTPVDPTLDVLYSPPPVVKTTTTATGDTVTEEERTIESIPMKLLAPGKGKIQYEYYQGEFSKHLPDFNAAELFELGFVSELTPRQPTMFSSLMYAYRFRTKLQVDHDGGFTFWLISCCGSALLIDGEMVINNDGIHERKEVNATIPLTSGYHDMEIRYFYNGIGQNNRENSTGTPPPVLLPNLELYYKAKDVPERSALPDPCLTTIEPYQADPMAADKGSATPTPVAAGNEAVPPVQELEEEEAPTSGADDSVPPPVTP